MKSLFSLLTLSCAGLLLLQSCYPMPTENDFSVVPTTNNPSVTKEKNSSVMPGIGY